MEKQSGGFYESKFHQVKGDKKEKTRQEKDGREMRESEEDKSPKEKSYIRDGTVAK